MPIAAATFSWIATHDAKPFSSIERKQEACRRGILAPLEGDHSEAIDLRTSCVWSRMAASRRASLAIQEVLRTQSRLGFWRLIRQLRSPGTAVSLEIGRQDGIDKSAPSSRGLSNGTDIDVTNRTWRLYRLSAVFLILKSSIRLPNANCATSQRGRLPRPAQVSND
jgi:hypothetical protein